MAPLTVPQLRSLARLYRDGVEGAAEQLDAHIEHGADQLAEVIGFPADEIPRLRATRDRVDVLVRTIEKAGAHHHAKRRASARSCAEGLVQGLLESACRVDAQWVEVDPMALGALVTCGGYDWLVLDTEFVVRGIPRGLLRAFFRECRGVEVQSARVGTNMLVLCYGGRRSRGILRLGFHHVPADADAVCVPLGRVALRAADRVPLRAAESIESDAVEHTLARTEPDDATHDATDIDNAPAPRPPPSPPSAAPAATPARRAPSRRPASRSRGFLDHLVDIIGEGL